MAGFCSNCGKPVEDNTVFCGGCGTRVGGGTSTGGATANPRVAAPAPEAPGVPEVAASSASPVAPAGVPPAAKASGGCGKILLIVVVVVGLLAALGIGGFAYLAYRAKKKVDEVRQAYKENNLEKMAGALGAKGAGDGDAKRVEAMPSYPEYTQGTTSNLMPGAAEGSGGAGDGDASMGSVVPMRAGLRITTAIQQSRGDYESIKSIRSVNKEGVWMEYSADVPEMENPFDKEQKKAASPKTQNVRATRKILRDDLENAHEYAQDFSPRLPVNLPGTTSLGVSAGVLNELKTKGESLLTYQATGLKGALGNLIGGLGGMAGGMGNAPGGQGKQAEDAMKDLQKMSKVSCTLKRTDGKTYSFPVLVNGVRTQLPAVRATCRSDEGEDAEFYFLDDAQNPLSLTWKLGASDRLQVIKLEYVPDKTARVSKELEQKLENKEKVQVYGIYFDFASAKIKPESKPTLDEIAGVMKAHPDWKLNVDGHTDNVGTDPGNLELSKQRAAAVKDVLVAEYHIGAERLDTNGFGASRPVEANSTMEGRARNRRVELSRE